MKNIFCIVTFLAFLFSISSACFAEESTTIDKDWKFSHLLANHDWPKKILLRDTPKEEFFKERIATLNRDVYYFSGRGKDFYGYENIEIFCICSNGHHEIRYLFSKLQDTDDAIKLYDKLISYLGKRFPNASRIDPETVSFDNKKLYVQVSIIKSTNRILVSFSSYK